VKYAAGKPPITSSAINLTIPSDPIAPLVFINGQDYPASKIFTLLHELAHIWIGLSGISIIDETLQTPALQIEEIAARPETEVLPSDLCHSTATKIAEPAKSFRFNTHPKKFSKNPIACTYFQILLSRCFRISPWFFMDSKTTWDTLLTLWANPSG
jgi:hypothetical protein